MRSTADRRRAGAEPPIRPPPAVRSATGPRPERPQARDPWTHVHLIYFDIDTLRPDHLGCYGYGRGTPARTSTPWPPAASASTTSTHRTPRACRPAPPCRPASSGSATGPSTTAGSAPTRSPRDGAGGFQHRGGHRQLDERRCATSGSWTASISTFAERHSAYHFDAGFNECVNLGTRGMETADQVAAVARAWLARNARRADWFLHVHLWDPHTPYRTPASFGDPFAGDAGAGLADRGGAPAAHWELPGPHSAQEIAGFGPRDGVGPWPRQPQSRRRTMDDVRRVFDGYDTGVRFADHHVGRVARDGRRDWAWRTGPACMVSADHGENLGELGIYCDHQTADQCTTRLPAVLHRGPASDAAAGPGRHRIPLPDRRDGHRARAGRRRGAGTVGWRVRSPPTSPPGRPTGRDHLVLSHAAWTAQRSVRFDRWICIRTYHDAFHGFPEVHAVRPGGRSATSSTTWPPDHPDLVAPGMDRLAEWGSDALSRSDDGDRPAVDGADGRGSVALAGGRGLVPRPAAGHRPGRLGRALRRPGLAAARGRPPRLPRPVSRRGRIGVRPVPFRRGRRAPPRVASILVDFDLSPELAALRDSVRRLAQDKIKPRAREIDTTGEYPQDIFDAFRDADLLGLCLPTELGGSGAGILGLTIAIEEVAKYSNTAALMLLLTRLPIGPDPDRRQRRPEAALPARNRQRCTRGAGFGLSESQAGSDVAGMRTRAVPDTRSGHEGDWVLTGTKCWMSGVRPGRLVHGVRQDRGPGVAGPRLDHLLHRRARAGTGCRSGPPTTRWACAASTPASWCSTGCTSRRRT